MANILQESTWKPIKLGAQTSGGYSINQHAVSSNWYNQAVQNTGNRLARLRRFHEADCASIEISRALDIMAEDISSSNADDEDVFHIEFPDDAKVKKTVISILESLKDVWEKRTLLDRRFYNRIRKTLKYGATFFLVNPDGTWSELLPERMVGYILSPEDENTVTHYIYDKNAITIEQCQHLKNMYRKQSDSKPVPIPVSDLVILKIGDKPFGESVIERVYSVWKKLSMLEDSMVIYRVVRAPERMVFYIDTGKLQGHKREAAVERQRLKFKQKQVLKNGEIDSEFDPHSTTENFFIPTNSQGRGSRVESIQGGQAMGETRDLEWFYRKLAGGLRIPFSMIDFQTSESGRDQFSDMRVGQVYQAEIRYMGFVKRIQRQLQFPLYENFFRFCRNRDILPPEGMELTINAPNSFAKYKDIEVNQQLLNVYQSTAQISSLSKRYAMQKYLQFDHEDLENNMLDKLREMGLTDDEIKELPDNIKANLVYGDGSKGEKFGITPPESMGRF